MRRGAEGITKLVTAVKLGSGTNAAHPAKVQAGAIRLVKMQQQHLPKIIQAVKTAGPSQYVKRSHWAWYVFPTKKEGRSDMQQVAVKSVDDVTFVLAAPTCVLWVKALQLLAEAVREQRSRSVFPSIDHGRIGFFLEEWAASEYRGAIVSINPDFQAALDAFTSAWKDALARR